MAVVDKREPEKIRKKLVDNGWKEEVLEVGDYIVGEVIIERKDIGDFILSYMNRRLDKQLVNMGSNRSILLVIGNFSKYYSICIKRGIKPISYPTFVKMVASITARFENVSVIHLPNDNALVDFLIHLDKRIQNRYDVRIEAILSKSKVKENLALANVLLQVPKITIKAVDSLVGAGIRLNDIARMSEKDLCKFDGVGKVLAGNIKKFCDEIL